MKLRINIALQLLFLLSAIALIITIITLQYRSQLKQIEHDQQQEIVRTAQDIIFLYSRTSTQQSALLNEYLARQTLNDNLQWIIISEDGSTVGKSSDSRLIHHQLNKINYLNNWQQMSEGLNTTEDATRWIYRSKLEADTDHFLLIQYDFSKNKKIAQWELWTSVKSELALIILFCIIAYILSHHFLVRPLDQITKKLPLITKGSINTEQKNSIFFEFKQINDAMIAIATQINQQLTDLRNKTVQYESTLQAIPDLLFELSEKGQYLQIHTRNPQLLYEQSALIGKNIHDVLPKAAAQIVQHSIQQAISYGSDSGAIIELDLPHGHCLFELNSTRLPHPDGRLSCLMLSRDITQAYNSRQLILRQNKLHTLIIETSIDGFWLIDQNGLIIEVNQAYLNLSGFTRDEVIGQPISRFDSTQTQEQIADNLAILRERGAINFETQQRKRTGELWDLDVSAGYLDLEDGLFFAFLRDISERKRQNEQLRLWERIFAQTTEGLVLTDTSEKILLVNTAFTTVTGYRKEELLGQRPSILASGRHDSKYYQQMHHSLNTLGHWQGEIWNRRKNGVVYPEWLIINSIRNDKNEITHYVGLLRDISVQKANEEQIRWLANYDALTHLPNRNLLSERATHALIQAQRQAEPLTLMYLDLDHFKHINDTLGHAAGDELLMQITQCLTQALREQDTIARQGGDEFVLLLPGVEQSGAITVAKKILQSVNRPIRLGSHELFVTSSIGIAIYPVDGSDFGTLSSHADAAMYKAKSEGRNCFRLYTPEMQSTSERRLKLESALRNALAHHELHLLYQPQIDLHTGLVCGAEALLRWNSQEFGPVSPAEFITLAEDNGLILEIGEWVLRQAMQQLKEWINMGLSPLCIAVNVSALQFKQENLIAIIQQVMHESQIETQFLELELTESVAMDDPEYIITKMHELSRIGVKLAIDDFGTGYSSLSYLKTLPIDKLKIDQSFVRDLLSDPDDAAIIQTIIEMAKVLGYITIAEGVENEEQKQLLQKLGCTQIQGYLLGKPMSASDFANWLSRH
ncbi:EAL domain-containing protein [Chitinibacter sp. SCUT-21]|uniref:sensor domain-containing protein n=1 Tax=Chitinibacter sp. SCUT-21 TaxID=2970891 RepID=UPI0035A6FF67